MSEEEDQNCYRMRDIPNSMRQETPSPTSQLNTSFSGLGPKPPTPTGSPKLRPKTASSGDTSIIERNRLRDNMDTMDSDPDDVEEIEEELEEISGTPDSPTGEQNIYPPDTLDYCSSSSPSPVPMSPKSQIRVRSKAVSKTQSLRDSLVQKFASSTSSGLASDKSSAAKESQKANNSTPIIGSTKTNPKTLDSVENQSTQTQEIPEDSTAINVDPNCECDPPSYAEEVSRSPNHPFGSHPVSRSGVVVPDLPPSGMADSRESPSFERGDKKSSPSRTLNNGTADMFNRNRLPKSRPSRLPRNVIVLPDKNLFKEKTNSNEHLSESAVGPTVHRKRTDGSGSSEGSDHAVTHTPRPPLCKRPIPSTTDSDDNSENECITSRPPTNSNSNAPVESRNSSSQTKSSRSSQSRSGIIKTPKSAGCNGGSLRTSPQNGRMILQTDSGMALRPEDTDECDSLPDDILHVQSDGETSPKNSRVGRLKTGSQELPMILNSMDKRTVPQIRSPAARQAKQQPPPPSSPIPLASGIVGLSASPPKSVSFNLPPDVVNYQKTSSEAPPATGRVYSSKGAVAERDSTALHRHVRRHSTDERFIEDVPDAKSKTSREMPVMVHENYLEQLTKNLQQQRHIVEQFKEGRITTQVYRTSSIDLLNIQVEADKRMIQFVRKPDS